MLWCVLLPSPFRLVGANACAAPAQSAPASAATTASAAAARGRGQVSSSQTPPRFRPPARVWAGSRSRLPRTNRSSIRRAGRRVNGVTPRYRLRIPRDSRVLVAAAFIASRAAFYAAGVRFDTSPVSYFWQLLDPELLRRRLAQSLWYLHAQPPLFNLLLGIDLKLFPSHYGAAFEGFYLALGLVLVLAVHSLGVRLGLAPWLAGAIAILVTVSPSAILYESFLFYDHLVVCLVVLSALALASFAERPRAGAALGFFAAIAALVLTRSLFHALWLVLLVAGLALACRARARAVLVAAALPLALVVALYAKNAVLFGGLPSGSSWLGMNLARTTVSELPRPELARLVARGELSPIVERPLFQAATAYRPIVPLRQPTGVPALDEVTKSTGYPNLNQATELDVSRAYLHADLWVIAHRPGAYLSGVAHALRLFFSPANLTALYGRNSARIHGWQRAYDWVVYGAFVGGVGVFLVVGYALAILVCLRDLARRRLGLVRGYLLATILYGLVVGNLVDAGENYRFRAMLDPLVAVLLAHAATRIVPAATKAATKRRAEAAYQRRASAG